MYKCKNFAIHELVDPETYKIFGQRAWEFFDPRLLKLIDKLRDTYGPATINNWKWGGKFKWSGLRTSKCKIGAKYSQHRFGRAADLKFRNVTPQEVRGYIKTDPYFDSILNCVENGTPTWLHVDVRNCEPIKWINP